MQFTSIYVAAARVPEARLGGDHRGQSELERFDSAVYLAYDPSNPPIAGERLAIYRPERSIYDIKLRGDKDPKKGEQLGYLVDALVDGAYAADYSIDGEKIDLRIIGRGGIATRTQDLDSLPIATQTGVVPLSALANIELSTGPRAIRHLERRRRERGPRGTLRGDVRRPQHRRGHRLPRPLP